jgi:hypothetical protein
MTPHNPADWPTLPTKAPPRPDPSPLAQRRRWLARQAEGTHRALSRLEREFQRVASEGYLFTTQERN